MLWFYFFTLIVPFLLCYFFYWSSDSKFIAGGLIPKSPGLALWCFGLALSALYRSESYPIFLIMVVLILPYHVACYGYRKQGSAFVLNGLLPLGIIVTILIIGRGLSFPGHCHIGDGPHCTAPGLFSYWHNHLLNLDLPFGPLTLMPVAFLVIPSMLMLASALAAMKSMRRPVRILRGLLLGAAVLSSVSHVSVGEWLPAYDGANGYCTSKIECKFYSPETGNRIYPSRSYSQ